MTARVRALARIAPRLQQGFGAIVIAFAAATYFQYDTLVVAWLTQFYPNGQTACNARERSMRKYITALSAAALALMASTLPGRSEDIAKTSSTIQVADATATAPEFTGLGNWFNSPPLTLSSLRGKVVLVNFWTYGCVNCVNTLPHVTQLYAKYKDRGPRDRGNPHAGISVRAFREQCAGCPETSRHHLSRRPGQQVGEWNAWSNQYWPAQYIVDRSGKIIYSHAGEGAYDEIDRTIDRLLQAQG